MGEVPKTIFTSKKIAEIAFSSAIINHNLRMLGLGYVFDTIAVSPDTILRKLHQVKT